MRARWGAIWARIRQPATILSGGKVVRLAITSSVLTVCSCVLLSWMLLNRHLDDVRAASNRYGEAVSAFLAREAELATLAGDRGRLQTFADTALTVRDIRYCRFFDEAGLLLAEAGAPVATDRVVTHLEGSKPWGADVVEFVAPIRTRIAPRQPEEVGFAMSSGPGGDARDEKTIGVVRLGMSLESMQEAYRRESRIAGAVTAAVAFLAVLTALLLTLGPLRALASTAELAAERARVAELRTRFVAQASHEFRTPLAVIHAAAEVMLRYGDRLQPAQQRERLAKIRGCVRHMTDLLADVLTIGRADAGRIPCERQAVDLEPLCAEMIADVQAGRDRTHKVLLLTRGLDGPLALDPKLIRQILRNLVTNAIKYSPAGSRVTVAIHRDRDVVRIEVRDEGIGIPPDDLRHLFEPFHRGANVGKVPGTGLGLAITHRAVTLHGGTSEVQSVVGRGTRFVVAIPLVDLQPPGQAGAPDVAATRRA